MLTETIELLLMVEKEDGTLWLRDVIAQRHDDKFSVTRGQLRFADQSGSVVRDTDGGLTVIVAIVAWRVKK